LKSRYNRKQAIETAKISIKSGGYGFRPTCDQFKPYRPASHAEHLTPLKPQELCRRHGRQPSLIQIPQHREPHKLPSLISRTVTPNTPRKSPGECHL
jgi:hypothetical protein